MPQSPDPFARIRTLFHFTDMTNLESIRRLGGLFSTARLREMNEAFCAGGDEQSLSLDTRCGMDGFVHLCWAHGHPMAGRIAERNPAARLTYLPIDRTVVYLPGVMFSTGIAYANTAETMSLDEACGAESHRLPRIVRMDGLARSGGSEQAPWGRVMRDPHSRSHSFVIRESFHMAERPIFVASPDSPELVKEIFFPLKWAPGFAAVQKEKNIKALHEAAAAAGITNVLEVSSKSEKERGRHLSAFHLKVRVPNLGEVPLECVFQGSKVFDNGGPYTDLYTKEAREAKKDPRLKESGALVAFEYEGQRWPLEPKTAFYDWLYASAIFPHREWARKLHSYGGFSDIEFNPFRSINCQARSIALFLSLLERGVLEDVLASADAFLGFLRNSSYRPQLRDHEIPDDGSVSYDEIGVWSEVKLAIIKDYASAYARILDATQRKTASSLKWLYIDAFAGPGIHLSKTSGEVVDGSPLIALGTQPAFSEYYFIDADPNRARQLRSITGPRKDVHIYSEDCNDVLLRDVFPKVKFENYRRALCLLDPYNINLKWEVIETAGKMGTVEVFLNFMIMDINRNALRRNPDKAVQSKIDQLTRLWGDETWKEAAYDTTGNLFGNPEKVSNDRFERAWRDRLRTKAGFKYVSEPMPMKTKTNSVIYYLYFASQRPVAADIVSDIFNKYTKKQGL